MQRTQRRPEVSELAPRRWLRAGPTWATAIWVAASLGGCTDTPPPSPPANAPGRCLATPTIGTVPLGDPTLPVLGAAASCRYAVWLAPKRLDGEALSTPQVYVYDVATAETFRTTDPAGDDSMRRWSPSLHGFWLAYASDNAVVVENLDALERTTLTPAPAPQGRVSLSYPWVAWTANEAAAPHQPAGPDRSAGLTPVIQVADLTTGWVEARTDGTLPAFEPYVDDNVLLYTLRGVTTDGTPRSQVFVDHLGAAAAPTPVAPETSFTRGGVAYNGLMAYLERQPDGSAGVRALDLDTGAPLGWLADSPDGPSLDAPLAAGAEVIAWPTGAGDQAHAVVWWPRTGELQTITPPAQPGRLSPDAFALGERTVLLPQGGPEGALFLTTLPAATPTP